MTTTAPITSNPEYLAIRAAYDRGEVPRGVLADWLDDAGMPEAAVLVRFGRLNWADYLIKGRYLSPYPFPKIKEIATLLLSWTADPETSILSIGGRSDHPRLELLHESKVHSLGVFLYRRPAA